MTWGDDAAIDAEVFGLYEETAQLRIALAWAMDRLGPEPVLIKGQNDEYCTAYNHAKQWLSRKGEN